MDYTVQQVSGSIRTFLTLVDFAHSILGDGRNGAKRFYRSPYGLRAIPADLQSGYVSRGGLEKA